MAKELSVEDMQEIIQDTNASGGSESEKDEEVKKGETILCQFKSK